MKQVLKKDQKDLYDALDFLYQSKSKDIVKPVFYGISIEGNNAITTDAWQLHLVESKQIAEIVDGLYNLTKIPGGYLIGEPIEGTFVNWKQVLPEDLTCIGSVTSKSSKSMAGVPIGHICHLLAVQKNARINTGFLDFIVSKDTRLWNIEARSIPTPEHKCYMSPVVFKFTTENDEYKYTAVIMPINTVENS